MDTSILSQATSLFQHASESWAVAMRPFMEDLLFDLISVQWFFLGLGYLFRMDAGVLFSAMIRFLIGNGFALFMVRYGYQYVGSWFDGVKHLAYFLGSPPLDPSAVAAYGIKVADPVMQSLVDQGFLSYVVHPTTWVFGFAGLSLIIAFYVLAFVLMSLLLMSYLLTAACPWFFMWWGLSFTRGITFGYIRLVFGIMNGLFCVMLMVSVVRELGEQLQVLLQTRFLTPGVSLGWEDYSVPLMVGIILCGVFVWIPFQWVRAVDGIVADWGGGRMLLGMGSGAIGGASQSIAGSRGGYSQGQIGTSQSFASAMSGGGQTGGRMAQRSGAWGKKE